ncbi:MAG TPA: peptidase M48, partial [candidate division Zixibacteria bacterium]|nr:peptidase M48 [candidate division Zixibacteria bacterium]
ATVPITGRRQLSLVPDATINQMSFAQYDTVIKTSQIDNGPNSQKIKMVGIRIADAVQQYFTQKGQANALKDYQWEFNLIKDDSTINAWCMPGGKVAVYTGILPVTKNDTGMAIVLGHEISHAVARHGDERMSQGILTQLGGVALEVALKNKPAQTQALFMNAYGAGATLGFILPYSRTQESEADHLGLIFMAMAGYDPHAAIAFWERMAQASKGAPPAFLSDHPSDQTRINDIQKLIPEAMQYYHPRR